MDILSVSLFNLDNDFDGEDPDTISLSNFWLGTVNLKNTKH